MDCTNAELTPLTLKLIPLILKHLRAELIARLRTVVQLIVTPCRTRAYTDKINRVNGINSILQYFADELTLRDLVTQDFSTFLSISYEIMQKTVEQDNKF